MDETTKELEYLREQKRLTDVLVEKARAFEWAAALEIERILKLVPGDRPKSVCASDPCPYCTAGSELDIARLDITSPGWRDDPIAY